MQNPILSQINNPRNNANMMIPQLQQIKNVINQIKMASNPQLALNELLTNNPQLQNALTYIKQNGGDPKTAAINMAKEKGINPQQIYNLLQ